jgi:phosphatidate cytidylyltransferase
MARRTLTALLLLVLILPAIYFGGVIFFAYLAIFVVVSAWEYVMMFQAVGFEPSTCVTVGGTLGILAARAFWPVGSQAVLTALILLSMATHLIAYERGRDKAALDFAITVAGFAYLGWTAAYMLDLRNLPDGGWWVMLVFPVIWLADTGAYFVGVQHGRHKMLPRLSPKKSWEGLVGGVVGGTLVGGFLAFAYTRFGPLSLSIWQGALLGLVLSAVSALGDMGESLFKRFAGFKDSGSLLPGHGGAFDRIDSLIWAGVIGYYCIRFLVL